MKVYLMRFSACLFVFASSNSLAALVDNGTYFTNTETNTDYLKLSQTVNSSWTTVASNDALGLIADGWQVASQAAYSEMATAASTRDDMWLLCDVCQSDDNAFPITNGDMSNGQFGLPTSIYPDFHIANGNYLNFSYNYSVSTEH